MKGDPKTLEVLLSSCKWRPGFLGGLMKFSEGLLCDSERRPGKSSPNDGIGVNRMISFSPTGLLFLPYLLMFFEERIK